MPKLTHRKIYDDDGEEMLEGSNVLVNGKFERILHFDENGGIVLSDWHSEDMIYSIEKVPDNRFKEIEDSLIQEDKMATPKDSDH